MLPEPSQALIYSFFLGQRQPAMENAAKRLGATAAWAVRLAPGS